MSEPARAPSPRYEGLLERAYQHALQHDLAEVSLRPMAAAIGSSPRVLSITSTIVQPSVAGKGIGLTDVSTMGSPC